MTDIIDALVDAPDIERLRDLRPKARTQAQRAFEALLEPEEDGEVPLAWRYVVAAHVAAATGVKRAAEFYADLLDGEDPEDEPQLLAGLAWAHRLTVAPASVTPEHLRELAAAGWGPDGVVTLSQLVAFLAFQLRVIAGLRGLTGAEDSPVELADWPPAVASLESGEEPGFKVLSYPDAVAPAGFVRHDLGWKPWVPPLERAELTEKQRDALIKPERAGMPYFRLLARDPEALKARTLTDLDIFGNLSGDGLSRAARELAATVVSRWNGCVYCASVHSQRALAQPEAAGREEDMDRLLAEGADVDLGDAEWNAVRDAALALTVAPPRFGEAEVARLRATGLSDHAVVDAVNSTAFFHWANRLMLTLGEPEVPKRFR